LDSLVAVHGLLRKNDNEIARLAKQLEELLELLERSENLRPKVEIHPPGDE
jgi:hypothetical protein